MMYNDQIEEEEDLSQNESIRSRWKRFTEQFRGRPDDAVDEGEYEAEGASVQTSSQWLRPAEGTTAGGANAAAPRREPTFRVATSRRNTISVTQVQNFADTQKVADRLKEGEPQVVNLEKTPADVAERLIDFLNGVTYALDGYVEKVAEGAYLFTPSHIAIHAETGGAEAGEAASTVPQPHRPFFDRP